MRPDSCVYLASRVKPWGGVAMRPPIGVEVQVEVPAALLMVGDNVPTGNSFRDATPRLRTQRQNARKSGARAPSAVSSGPKGGSSMEPLEGAPVFPTAAAA